jgi:hypothetical protein
MSQKLTAIPASGEIKSVDVDFQVVDRPERRTKLGRPATLTLRRFIIICRRVESGWSIVKAAESQGVTYRALRLRVAQNPRLAERLREAEQIRFNLRCEIACESVMRAGEHSWMAHAWWLERNLPHLYALRSVARPDPEQQMELEEEIPAEALARHRALVLALAREDEARVKLSQGESAG